MPLSTAKKLLVLGALNQGVGGAAFRQGWDSGLNLGTDGDYFFATDGNDANPGTLAQPFLTPQAAVDKVILDGVPRTIRGRSGTYPPFDLDGLAGAAGNRVRILGYGTEKPVIDAGTVLAGLTVCDSGDEATVGPNYASIYKATITKATLPYTNFVALNIREAGTQIYIATDRQDVSAPFWTSDIGTFFTADSSFGLDGSSHISTITDVSAFTPYILCEEDSPEVYLCRERDLLPSGKEPFEIGTVSRGP